MKKIIRRPRDGEIKGTVASTRGADTCFGGSRALGRSILKWLGAYIEWLQIKFDIAIQGYC